MNHIVKRGGHLELYDGKKLYASIYAAALAVRQPVSVAEVLATEIVDYVEKWLQKKHEVTSNDTRRKAHEHLSELNTHVAVQYLHHRVVW